jgi:sarcosine oxidase / L-pipecolate oxidase
MLQSFVKASTRISKLHNLFSSTVRMGSSGYSYLIIGAGVFGASTALHLKESDPSAHITLVDRTPFPCPYAASHDLNKIVRADYGDIFYSKLALEAQQGWRDDAIYAPFYHESGLLNVENTGLGRRMIQNYKDLGVDFTAEIISPEDTRLRFDGLFQHADWTDVKEVFWNPRSGWAQATDALKKAIEVAVERGVSYVEATVSTLLFDEDGACIGVEATDSQRITADHVILCTGAQTPQLLADSAPHRKELQTDGRLIAAGVITAYVQLTPEQIERYRGVPVLVNGMSQTLGSCIHCPPLCHCSPGWLT